MARQGLVDMHDVVRIVTQQSVHLPVDHAVTLRIKEGLHSLAETMDSKGTPPSP
jgi:hypothetical protein